VDNDNTERDQGDAQRLNEPLSKRIEEARNEVDKIQSDLEEVKKWTDKIHLPLHQPPPADKVAEADQYNKFHYLSTQLAVAQQILSSLLLQSLKESTDKLDSSVKALDDSAESQLAITKNLLSASLAETDSIERLQKSSLRVEILTGALLLATAVLVLFGSDSYFFQMFTAQGYTPSDAIHWATMGSVVTEALYAVALTVLLVIYLPMRKNASKVPTIIQNVAREKDGHSR